MSDLTFIEKTRLEQQLQMEGGYVLDFSNRRFADFVAESTGRDINDEKYLHMSGSKANRLRAFWKNEPNHLVGRLLSDLLDYCATLPQDVAPDRCIEECRRIAARLRDSSPVDALQSIVIEDSDKGFNILARAVRAAIETNEPEAGLDRLHTYVTKYVRELAERRGVSVTLTKPLHSIFGEYIKALKAADLIESEMTIRILKSTISTLEAFNDVRNERSLAHDNPTLGYDESLLIFNHVCCIVRFLRSLEDRTARPVAKLGSKSNLDDEVPF